MSMHGDGLRATFAFTGRSRMHCPGLELAWLLNNILEWFTFSEKTDLPLTGVQLLWLELLCRIHQWEAVPFLCNFSEGRGEHWIFFQPYNLIASLSMIKGGGCSRNEEDARNHTSLHATIFTSDHAPCGITWGFLFISAGTPQCAYLFSW